MTDDTTAAVAAALPTEYRFELTKEQRERAAISNLTTDMSTYELGEWILQLQRENERLKRLWKDDPTVSDEFGKRCFWCDVAVEDYEQPIPHLGGCPWKLIVADTPAEREQEG